MKIFLGRAALALAIGLTSVGLMIAPANAKGCLKGGAVGGVAGHVAGHHGFVGAAAGLRDRTSRGEEERQEQSQSAVIVIRAAGSIPL